MEHNQSIYYTKLCLIVTFFLFVVTKFLHENNKIVKTNNTNSQECKKMQKKTILVEKSDMGIQVNLDNISINRSISTEVTQDLDTITSQLKSESSSTTLLFLSTQQYSEKPIKQRTFDQSLDLFKQKQKLDDLFNEEVLELVTKKQVQLYKLESYFTDPIRAVSIRRAVIATRIKSSCLNDVPFENYNYSKVMGSCCENVIGYVPVPLGVAGPLLIDGKMYQIPMATTEGTLIASTNRGCTALSACQGVSTQVLSDQMTRGPVMKFHSAMRAAEVKEWLEEEESFFLIKKSFDSTSRFAKLETIKCCVVGRYLYIRFGSKTGDAMGMNMLSKVIDKF
jgi:hydroxymethylglutaryl-CoA reductase (NADPH)